MRALMTELCSRSTGLLPQTRDRWLVGGCLHFTASCTTGWVNYANEPSQAALERSSQDA